MRNPGKHRFIKAVTSLSPKVRAAVVAGAVLAAGGGAALATAGASAATANCPSCITFSSQAFGTGFVLNANNATNVRLRNLSNTYTNEDFIVDGAYHTVSWFVSHGYISSGSYAAVNYPNFIAFQLEGAPNGVPNDKCVGLAAPATNGEGVTKQPCGVNAQTLWIFDRDSGTGGNCLSSATLCPLINGSDTNFSNPEALTATSNSFQLHVTSENNNGPGSEAGDTQQFTHTP
jgi:hypothetical protein